uniref:Secreted protein n=1 Tax=Trichogramma kaykai TaxID=54128 RepID=A0ABD2WMY7_9HYME
MDQRITFVALRAAIRLHAVDSVQARSSQGSFNGATFDRTISRCAVLQPAGQRICIRSSFTQPKNSIRKRRRRRCEREGIKGEERQERNVRKKINS